LPHPVPMLPLMPAHSSFPGDVHHHQPQQSEALGPPSWFKPPPTSLDISLGRPVLAPALVGPSCVDFNVLPVGAPAPIGPNCVDFNVLPVGLPPKCGSHLATTTSVWRPPISRQTSVSHHVSACSSFAEGELQIHSARIRHAPQTFADADAFASARGSFAAESGGGYTGNLYRIPSHGGTSQTWQQIAGPAAAGSSRGSNWNWPSCGQPPPSQWQHHWTSFSEEAPGAVAMSRQTSFRGGVTPGPHGVSFPGLNPFTAPPPLGPMLQQPLCY